MQGIKPPETTESIQKSFDDIGFAAGAASGLVSQLGVALLGPDSSALERAAVSIVGSLASIAIAGAVASAGQSAAGTGPAAIFTLPVFLGIGLAAVAAALSGTGARVSGSGGGQRSPATSKYYFTKLCSRKWSRKWTTCSKS